MLDTIPDKSLNGLILMGGSSTRFGSPKGLQTFDAIPQWHRLLSLLSPYCKEVFFSFTPEIRTQYSKIQEQSIIYDSTNFGGPLAGIISAMGIHPTSNWLVVSVDLFFLEATILDVLYSEYKNTNKEIQVIAFHHEVVQPLCSIYFHSCFAALQKWVDMGNHSVFKAINTMEKTILSVPPTTINPFIPTNTKEELQELLSTHSL